MKEEKQRIAIAEICDLFRLAPLKRTTRKGNDDPNGVKLWYCVENFGGAKEYAEVPFYPRCLNAMHGAEKVLQKHMAKWWNYTSQLAAANSTLGTGGEAHATAEQRAEAFLRVFGKWEETE